MKFDNTNINIKQNSCIDLSFGIVKSLWNKDITDNLYIGAKKKLKEHGVKSNNIFTLNVPGSFELIYGTKKIIKTHKLHGVIVIGSIIKGETPHFEFISQTVSNGIKDLNILFDIPIIFCVLTDLNKQQATDRSGGKHGNKGEDAALAALHLLTQ